MWHGVDKQDDSPLPDQHFPGAEIPLLSDIASGPASFDGWEANER